MSEENGKLPIIRNRIKEVCKMRLGDISHNHMNWRGIRNDSGNPSDES